MKAGILKEVIELYEPKTIITEFGNQQTDKQYVCKTRASVQYDSGSRINQNDEIFYPVTKTFIVRYYIPVTEPMRIKHDNKFYRIISIEPNKYYNDKRIVTELINE